MIDVTKLHISQQYRSVTLNPNTLNLKLDFIRSVFKTHLNLYSVAHLEKFEI